MNSLSWKTISLICAFLVQICRARHYHYSSPEDDEIVSLPGQPAVTFKQYGGYITVDQKQGRALFYYFAEAESNPDSKPLVLWLNGGPGCSSVGAGAFSEHGPFRASGGETLIRNNFSWNKKANMLYLESPAGVGFSYSANASFYSYVNDAMTAQDNLKFLEQWFLKYPKYKNRDFYMTGESYAGHYVPQLADAVIKSGLKFNLKGIAIGNPLLEFDSDINAEGDYYWSHGLISDATYRLVKSTCNTSQLYRGSITGSYSAACEQIKTILSKEIPELLDTYDVTLDSCLSSSGGSLFSAMKHPLARPRLAPQSSHLKGGENVDLCVQDKATDYLNSEAVQKAFHARLVGVTRWEICSDVLRYDMRNLEIPTIGVVGALIGSGIRVLVYSGDQDSVIPFSSSRSLVDGLATELGLNTIVPYRAWFLNKQVGGWTQVYHKNLTFATIRGASHLSPFSSPKRALALFSTFLAGKPLPEA